MARPLTRREAEIASMAAEGLSVRAISQKLGTAFNTVRHQFDSIYSKLDIYPDGNQHKGRYELVVKVLRSEGALKPTLIELTHRLEEATAERDAFRMENRKLRDKLSKYEASS